MYITDIVQIDKKKAKIVCDKAVFVLYLGEIRKLNLEIGKDISDELYNLICEDILYKRAKERALYLIETMERTEYQIRKKLIEGCYPTDIIERVIAFLNKYGFIDDRLYAEKYWEYSKNSKSARLISMDLLKKGINKSIIDEVLENNEEDEKKQIIKILEKKKYMTIYENIKEKNKIISYLLRRGYSYDLIQESINDYLKN